LGTSYKTEIDPCNSKFIFVAKDLKRKLVLRASAPKKSFSRVAIPTKHGFKADGAIESFSATISIKAYKRNLFDEDQLIETKSFNNAALEFGGDYINCPSYDSTFSKLK
jgi:hypothetical protein